MFKVLSHILMATNALFIYGIEHGQCILTFQDLNNEELLKQIKYENEANGNYYSPDQRYYLLIMKVNAAVSRNILMLLHHTRVYDRSGTSSDLYRVVGTGSDVRLPSLRDVTKANTYFDTHPEAVQQIIAERSNPFGDGSNYNSYRDILEATERGLPNIFTAQYMTDAVKDMELQMRGIGLEEEPSETYYRLVLKVAEALKRNNIIRIPNTFIKGGRGVNTELYRDTEKHQQILLPTIEDLKRARDYFMNKKIRLKELIKRQKQNYLSSQMDSNGQSYNINDNVRTMVFEMISIQLDSVPDDLYYKLVRKVDTAIKRNLLIAVEDTECIWAQGVKTVVYNVVGKNSKVVLPSVIDLPDAVQSSSPVTAPGDCRDDALRATAGQKQPLITTVINGSQWDAGRPKYLRDNPHATTSELASQKERYQDKSAKKGGFIRRWFRRIFKGKH